MSDEIRDWIRKLDPMHPAVEIEPPIRSSLEEIMSGNESESTAARPTHSGWYVAVAAVAVLGLALGLNLSGDEPPSPTAGTPIQLSLGQGPGLASCLPFDTAILADMPMAFEATAKRVDGESVNLEVDQWFVGGNAAEVTLHAESGMQALIGGIDFVEGGRYLISATDGNVNYCGYSDVATPELRSAFDEAFSG